MDACDVVVVGGGPAGSSCARGLRQAGLDVVLIDKAVFPRDKICAGWITPQVVEALQLDVSDYCRGRVFQPIDSFYVALFGRPGVDASFDQTVSFGIRRCEFDEYLLRRSDARLRLGEGVRSVERTPAGWRLNGNLEARMLVGAGGHFCPIARTLRTEGGERGQLVTAVEAEFPMPDGVDCSATDGTTPRLYFRDDLAGYGWCVRKGDYLNIGVGLVDSRATASEISRLMEVLKEERAFVGEVPARFRGHAYYLYDGCRTKVFDDGVLLIGDAAGLAYPQSGEGIRPAVESGLLAAQVIVDAGGRYERSRLAPYQERLISRLGMPKAPRTVGPFDWITRGLRRAVVRRLIRSPRFVRNSVIRDSFLHARDPVLIV